MGLRSSRENLTERLASLDKPEEERIVRINVKRGMGTGLWD